MVLWTALANPAGNIIAFVLNDVDKQDYTSVAARLLNKNGLDIEQVGFVKPPIYGGKARLEMMGGEFCGNAVRSFGLYIALKRRQFTGNVLVEVSGLSYPLSVQVDVSGNAVTEMPLPVNQWKLMTDLGAFDVIEFEGVAHVIVPEIPASRDIFAIIRKAAEDSFTFNALGVMFLDPHTLSLQPAFYMPANGSIVFEKSCGSGSTAVGVWLSDLAQKVGESVFRLNQPGGVLEVTAVRKEKRITRLRLGGPVTLTPARSISV